jgi:hypothetical protein
MQIQYSGEAMETEPEVIDEGDVMVMLDEASERLGRSADEVLEDFSRDRLPDSSAGFYAARAVHMLRVVATS